MDTSISIILLSISLLILWIEHFKLKGDFDHLIEGLKNLIEKKHD